MTTLATLTPVTAIVYQATNRLNGHRYIGLTIQGLAAREREHRKLARRATGEYHFHRAMRKYGEENFFFELMGDFGEDQELAKIYEREAIEAYKPEYNLTYGGEGGSMPLITRQRISASNKGRVSPMKGRKFTEEHKANIRKGTKGVPHLSVRGVPFTAERRRKLSLAAMGRPGNGRRAVACLTDGRVFDSIAAAAKHYDTWPGYIRLVASGRKKSIKGLTFKFMEPGA